MYQATDGFTSAEFPEKFEQNIRRQKDAKSELRNLLTEYLGKDGIRWNLIKAQKEREALGQATNKL
jgi:hypothetical protein